MSDYREYDDGRRAPAGRGASKMRPQDNNSGGNNARPAARGGGRGGAGGRGGGGNNSNFNDYERRNQQGGGGQGGNDEEFLRGLKQVDLSEMKTEEAIQNEKRRQAEEIREGVRDIHECYSEFSTLVQHQQEGIDTASKNVEVSVTNVQKATEELHQAGEYQKTSRKLICCIVVILLVVIAVVVVVIVVLKKD